MKNKAILFLILIIITSSCSDKLEQMGYIVKNEELPDITVKELFAKYNTNSKLKATVSAPITKKYDQIDQPYLEFPKGVHVIFYNDSIKKESELTAEYAIYYEKKQLWEARKNVVVTNEKGSMLKTEQLFGDEKQQKIFSVKKVTIIEPDSTVIQGKKGFESNTSFTIYKFLDVNGIIQLKEEYDNTLNIEDNETEASGTLKK